ncbi:MAG: hypothetical protein ACRC5T_10565, partial [Cetobacterium sp.]
ANRIKICLNYGFLENGLNVGEAGIIKFKGEDVYTIILHELLHNFFLHLTRFKKYEEQGFHKLVNIVTDYYCNEFISRLYSNSSNLLDNKDIGLIMYSRLQEFSENNGCGKLPFSSYEEKPLEQIVIDHFLTNKEKWLPIDNKNSVQGTGEFGDSHSAGLREQKKSLDKANEDRELKGKVKITEEYALKLVESYIDIGIKNSSDQAGLGESEFLRFYQMINKKDDFLNFVKIMSSIKSLVELESNKLYKRASRRRQDGDIIFKGKVKDDGKKVVIGIDVSGSVGDEDLEKIYNMLNSFVEKRKSEAMLDVIFWSSCKVEDKHFNENINSFSDLKKLKPYSSGGTDVKYLYDFLEEKYKNERIVFLNITDGFFDYLEEPKVLFKHYVVLTESIKLKQMRNFYEKATINCVKVKG